MNVTNETILKDSIWDFKGKIPYVDDWIFMKTPGPMLAFLFGYLLIVYAGPKAMKSRPPMKLQTILVYYNIVQVLLSMLLVQKCVKILAPHGLLDNSCLMKDDNLIYETASAIHLYYLAKVIELLDTVFFILRKKQNQVTFLHVYHHASTMYMTWIFLKYEPTYSVLFLGAINSFIHVIMYAYYGLSAFPSLTKYLWWKKYITKMQLTQFVMMIIHAAVNYVYGSCKPSILAVSYIIINTALLIYLFGDFYIQAYIKNEKSKQISKFK